ncbi:lytic murein transglycosylase [Sphingomonas laterariae]|uniref:Lytic murein transglycosylase n=1 Tax=Edaphosphingomonas laterariae TaxID=861865 RepID=A0A239BBX5_9SPHN|nr:lytic murein transglycosylase [Sphingomonas laterariae]SNS04664.1 lytic murein transglycosylase [Sphingomonas laterariae]
MRISFRILALAAALAVLPNKGVAQSAATSDAAASADENAAFQAFLRSIRPRALAAGVRPATFDSATAGLTFNARVIRLDRAQPGGNPNAPAAAIPRFAPYKARHVDADRINRGRKRYQDLRPRLARIEQRTGVPESIMMAIYGHETGYGTYTGDFDLIRSLASLAYDGRRRELFTAELIATLQLLDRGIPRSTLKGSWAGATGYPQFLPSMYQRLAVDGDGDGRIDIWSNETDALASIGNYLVQAGWKPNVPWGVAAIVPTAFDRSAVRPLLRSPRCARVHERHSRWLSIGEWKAMGVRVTGWPAPADGELATLLEPDGPGATAYLLTNNYRVILDYNCSNFYALSVGLLADEVAR